MDETHWNKILFASSWPSIYRAFMEYINAKKFVAITTWNCVMPVVNPCLQNVIYASIYEGENIFLNGSTTLVGPGRFFSLLIYSQSVGLLGRVISSSQGLYLNTGQHKYEINTYTHQITMPWMGFEPTITASERAKTVHILDRPATVTG
jgi:hypothetical protein